MRVRRTELLKPMNGNFNYNARDAPRREGRNQMRVDVLAQTAMHDAVPIFAYDYRRHADEFENVEEADALAAFSGRICYKSFNRPNPATAANADYLANILKQHHFSVLEHASVTFLVRDVSRALLAELTRHRHLSFSVVSQRYVDYSETEPVIPPAIGSDGVSKFYLSDAYREAIGTYEVLVGRLRESGLSRKAAREAARAVLPNAAPVDMVVTGNLRAWRDVLGKRHHVAADAELQEFAGKVLELLRDVAPNSVQDIPEKPYGSSPNVGQQKMKLLTELHKQLKPVPAEHIGNNANAEDCDGCTGTNPPYPFLCPGDNRYAGNKEN